MFNSSSAIIVTSFHFFCPYAMIVAICVTFNVRAHCRKHQIIPTQCVTFCQNDSEFHSAAFSGDVYNLSNRHTSLCLWPVTSI